MKSYHLFFVCCLLWFTQQRTVSSNTCSEDEKMGGSCSTDKKTHMYDIKGEIYYIEQGGYVINALFLLKSGTSPSKITSLTVKDVSEWLLQNVEKYPTGASTIGLGISVYLLYDSLADNEEVNRIKKEYEELLSTSPDIFKRRDDYTEHVIKRTNQIRKQVIGLKSWQGRMTIVKALVAGVFGWIGFSTQNPTIKPLAFASAGLTGIGALVNSYNWGALHALVQRLEKTGYIV